MDAEHVEPVATGAPALEVNGRAVAFREGLTVAQLLADLHIDGKRTAIERNRELLPRAQWAETLLLAGDRIEIVEFVGGG